MRAPLPAQRAANLAAVRWATVATLVVCAVLSWLQARDASALPPALAPLATPVATALAVGIILARQMAQRAQAPSTRLRALLGTYLLCASLGGFGLFLAVSGDDGSRGALFALGGAIFAVGTPPGFGRPA